MFNSAVTACTLFVFWLLLREARLEVIMRAIRSAAPFGFSAACALSLIGSAGIGSLRFRESIAVMGTHLSLREAFLIKMGSQPLSLLPYGKVNLLAQVCYLKRCRDVPLFSGAQYMLFGLWMNYCALSLIVVAGLFLAREEAAALPLRHAFALAGFLVLCLVPFFMVPLRRFSWAQKYLVFPKAGLKAYLALAGYSLLFQGLPILVFVLLARSINVPIPLYSAFLFVPLVTLISAVPVTVAGLGVRESSVIYFYQAYGSKEELLALGILFSFSEYLLPALFGLFFARGFLGHMVLPAKEGA